MGKAPISQFWAFSKLLRRPQQHRANPMAFLLSAASSRFLGLPPKETTSTHSLPQALFSDIINRPSEVGTSYTHFTDEESEAMSA